MDISEGRYMIFFCNKILLEKFQIQLRTQGAIFLGFVFYLFHNRTNKSFFTKAITFCFTVQNRILYLRNAACSQGYGFRLLHKGKNQNIDK